MCLSFKILNLLGILSSWRSSQLQAIFDFPLRGSQPLPFWQLLLLLLLLNCTHISVWSGKPGSDIWDLTTMYLNSRYTLYFTFNIRCRFWTVPFCVSALCGERVSQMTRTYNDVEAVTLLLEEVSLSIQHFRNQPSPYTQHVTNQPSPYRIAHAATTGRYQSLLTIPIPRFAKCLLFWHFISAK